MDDDNLADQLEAIADAGSEHAALLETAATQLRGQQSQIESLQTELEETNEGMVALTLELQRAEKRYRSLFEEAIEGIYKTTPDAHEYTMANQSMADILGYETPEKLQQTSGIEEVFVNNRRYSQYRSALRNDEQLANFEYRIRRTDGEIRWVSDNVRKITDENGQIRYRGSAVDITEQKEYEKRLESRNEALEALNRVVRHDIGNDVQVISTWAQHLEDKVGPEDREALDRIRRKAESITEITREAAAVVETLADEEETELEPVALESTLLSEIERQSDSHPDVKFDILTDIPFVQVSANEMLGSVFRNVLTNAVTHNNADEPIIEVSCDQREDDVLVRIADNGPGISDERKDDIFTKGVQSVESDGTGIGLYLVNHLVTEYGGEVWVEDTQPADDSQTDGAMFVLTLPLSA